MDRSFLEIEPGLWLDARRALFLAETQTLVVADLHLGYAWAHRHGGQMLPISVREDALLRLLSLVESYAPRELVLLGDIVHRAVPVEALQAELGEVFDALNTRVRLVFLAGNHDRHLSRLLEQCGIAAELRRDFESGANFFAHGDAAQNLEARRDAMRRRGGRIFIGHEHPAISISDGVATSAKCPCFLISAGVIVLPAFSRWAAGTEVRGYPRMSPWARHEVFSRAVAIIGGKLLPISLRG